MNRWLSMQALLVVSVSLLTSCTGRTILHGAHAVHRTPVASVNKRVSVWFVKPDSVGSKIMPVSRAWGHGDRLQQAVEDLLEGPSAKESSSGLASEIPRGTILLGVERKGKSVELNLSKRFATGGGSDSFETRLEQLRKTVAESAGPSDVFLSVEGKRLNISEGEGIEVHQPINR